MRRPAGAKEDKRKRPAGVEEIDLEAEALKRWEKGYTVLLRYLDTRALETGSGLVVTEGTYYHRRVTLAGKVNSVTVSGGVTTAKMALTGTGDEELLKFHTSHPGVEIRAHVCGAECNKEEAAEDLVHIQVGRKMREEGAEDPWVTNLMKVAAPEERPLGKTEQRRRRT